MLTCHPIHSNMEITNKIYTLDLEFLNEDAAIASFLIESNDGLVLVESGPETTFEHLTQAIANLGFDWKDVRHVLLTHIHFDHAGAAWKFAENQAKIYVHPIGLPHLHQPEKLWNSAKMIYKEDMERLWGEMQGIPTEYLVAADDGVVLQMGGLEFKVHYTPGHAIHHNAYQLDNVLFTGDVAGVKINQGPVVPPCPPPDIDLKKWMESIDRMQQLPIDYLYLTHYGKVEHPKQHWEELKVILNNWAEWMKPHFEANTPVEEITPRFMEYTRNQLSHLGVSPEDIQRYEYANPSWMSVTGLLRYWKLKEQGRI